MRSKLTMMLTFAATIAIATPLAAQGRGRGQAARIPPGHLPPAGMCRIWLNGVPPGQQPAPTDCETAVRNQPPNSRIIWGDNTSRAGRRHQVGRTRDREIDRDDRRRRSDIDRDRDRDRVRDRDRTPDDYPTTPVDRGQYPSQLPAMTGAVLIRVGVRTVDVQNWLGRGDLRSETTDANGDGVPELARWYDGRGALLQVWRDDDRDGRADSVEIYRDGRRVDVVR